MSKVLVVDNQPFNVDLVTTILERGGFEVIAAHDGPTAISMVEKMQPDLVLMDVQLPGMDGLEVTRLLRESPSGDRIKIVAFSALGMPEDRKRASKAGCDGYITKPVGARELIDAVKTYLRGRTTKA